ncbi:hypothetical protein QBC43DRAFT_357321 [Cladorrhinum sp. PSN259]|nr:hypothetical protein QBC43DRAFT_357321 [Cladorrhinum sp. PSN259]
MESNIASRISKPLKRFACDRCKGQKIRCKRPGDDGTKACNRCIESRVPCVTSPTKPPGRPTISKLQERISRQRRGSQQQQQEQNGSRRDVNTSATSRTAGARVQEAPGPEPTEYQTAAQSESPLSPSLTGFIAATAPSIIPSSDVPRKETSLTRAHIYQAQGYGMFNYSPDTDMDVILIGGPGTLDHVLPAINISSPPSSSSASTAPEPRTVLPEVSTNDPGPSSASPGPSNVDLGVRLASLYQDLCRQLSIVHTAPLHLKQLSILTSVMGGIGIDRPDPRQIERNNDTDEPVEVNHLSALLRNITDLLNLSLQLRDSRYQCRLGSPRPQRLSCEKAATSTLQDEQQLIPTAQLLTLLSSYLQIISISEVLLSRLCDGLEDETSSWAVVQPAQTKQAGTASPNIPPMMHHKLLLRLFGQTIQYFLEQVEETLGVPKDFSVARRGSDYQRGSNGKEKDAPAPAAAEELGDVGLLAGRQGKAMVAAVMWKDECQNGENIKDKIDGGFAVVEALRRCLWRVYSC